MADFYAPQFNPPADVLGSYIRGQMAPLQVAQAQQQVQTGQLNLDQLRQMMAIRQSALKNYQDTMTGINQSSQGGAQATGNEGGGIQNGPQSAVSQPPSQPQGTSYGGNDPLAPLLDPRRIAAGAALSSLNAGLSGEDPNKPIADALKLQTDARSAQIAQAKLQAEIPSPTNPMPMFKSFAAMDPDSAGASLANNPGLLQQWPQLAQKYGFDPWDKSKIPVVAALEYNQRGAPLGLSVDVPQQLKNVNLGQGEIAQIDRTGKKVGDLVERQTPSFTLVDRWDPNTNQTVKVPVQTGGYGMQGVGPQGSVVGNSPIGRFPASAASLGFNTGFKPPSDPELKAAMFGSEMRSGMDTLNQMEKGGFTLDAKNRTAFINAATSEDEGALKQFISQMYQEHMDPRAQTYIAAAMPVIQAAGHDQSGARLATSTIRTNLEGLFPPSGGQNNQQLMDQINKNRQGFYVGLLGQAGSATQLPQYRNTLGADLKNTQGQAAGTTKVINGNTYIKRDGKWYAD